MKGSAYTIAFAAALGSACALLLTTAAAITKPHIENNRRAEEALNVLMALNVPMPEKFSSKQEIIDLRDENVETKERPALDDDGKPLTDKDGNPLKVETYVYSQGGAGGEVLGIARRFKGKGLWGYVKGFLALEPDMETIRGMTIYEQEETPGLGGEIAEPWFRDQFVGKKIVDEAGVPGIIIAVGGEPAANKVDGISGATMTCDKVQAMLNEAIKRIVEEK